MTLGVETYTDRNYNAEDQKLAECIHKRLVKYTGMKDRGIKRANWAVINQNQIPAVLTEGSFIDGIEDYKYIITDEGQDAYARAIVDGEISHQLVSCKKYLSNCLTVSWEFDETGKDSNLIRKVQIFLAIKKKLEFVMTKSVKKRFIKV